MGHEQAMYPQVGASRDFIENKAHCGDCFWAFILNDYPDDEVSQNSFAELQKRRERRRPKKLRSKGKRRRRKRHKLYETTSSGDVSKLPKQPSFSDEHSTATERTFRDRPSLLDTSSILLQDGSSIADTTFATDHYPTVDDITVTAEEGFEQTYESTIAEMTRTTTASNKREKKVPIMQNPDNDRAPVDDDRMTREARQEDPSKEVNRDQIPAQRRSPSRTRREPEGDGAMLGDTHSSKIKSNGIPSGYQYLQGNQGGEWESSLVTADTGITKMLKPSELALDPGDHEMAQDLATVTTRNSIKTSPSRTPIEPEGNQSKHKSKGSRKKSSKKRSSRRHKRNKHDDIGSESGTLHTRSTTRSMPARSHSSQAGEMEGNFSSANTRSSTKNYSSRSLKESDRSKAIVNDLATNHTRGSDYRSLKKKNRKETNIDLKARKRNESILNMDIPKNIDVAGTRGQILSDPDKLQHVPLSSIRKARRVDDFVSHRPPPLEESLSFQARSDIPETISVKKGRKNAAAALQDTTTNGRTRNEPLVGSGQSNLSIDHGPIPTSPSNTNQMMSSEEYVLHRAHSLKSNRSNSRDNDIWSTVSQEMREQHIARGDRMDSSHVENLESYDQRVTRNKVSTASKISRRRSRSRQKKGTTDGEDLILAEDHIDARTIDTGVRTYKSSRSREPPRPEMPRMTDDEGTFNRPIECLASYTSNERSNSNRETVSPNTSRYNEKRDLPSPISAEEDWAEALSGKNISLSGNRRLLNDDHIDAMLWLLREDNKRREQRLERWQARRDY